jgi:hypothetical protein
VRHFKALLEVHPDDLALRCGWLVAQRERLDDAALHAEYEAALDAFIEAAEQRYESNSGDDEALFYLANGYLLRGGYRIEHDKGLFGAARDGKHAKMYIEAYVAKHPENNDAYFALGMYNYYVDIAPNFVQFLRFLLSLPGGDRVEGLRQLERVAAQGRLLGPLARRAGENLRRLSGAAPMPWRWETGCAASIRERRAALTLWRHLRWAAVRAIPAPRGRGLPERDRIAPRMTEHPERAATRCRAISRAGRRATGGMAHRTRRSRR